MVFVRGFLARRTPLSRPSASPRSTRRLPLAMILGTAALTTLTAASAAGGLFGLRAQVFASDMRHFERVLERIAGEPFVERTKSVLVLSPLLRRFSSGSPA